MGTTHGTMSERSTTELRPAPFGVQGPQLMEQSDFDEGPPNSITSGAS